MDIDGIRRDWYTQDRILSYLFEVLINYLPLYYLCI